jgi:hypothetical protein
VQSALQERPEILHPVHVNLSIDVALSVIDKFLRIVLANTEVSDHFISVKMRSAFSVLMNRRDGALPIACSRSHEHELRTFKHSLDCNFAAVTATLAFEGAICRLLRALPPMYDP